MATKRGGKRQGAGRKKDVSKDLATGAATALRILEELKHEEAIKKIYDECGDRRLQAHIIFRLREWAFGKPGLPTDPEANSCAIAYSVEEIDSAIAAIIKRAASRQS